jgi:hypothetical protein
MRSRHEARLLYGLYNERFFRDRFKKFSPVIILTCSTSTSLFPILVDNDSISLHTSEPNSSAKIPKELPDEVDYNSDCEFLNEAEKRDHHSSSSNTRSGKTDSSSHMTVSEMIPVQVQSSSAQVSDNWETLQVRTCPSHLHHAVSPFSFGV